MTAPTNVLVFGATGSVGSLAAAAASSRGAHVTLAVRDPSKPVDASIAHFPKVQADLLDPASAEKAAKESGAKAAFLYAVMGSDLRETLGALVRGGVTHVVFLSTSWLPENLESVAPDDEIPWRHAIVERAAMAIPGLSFTSVRPGRHQLAKGKVSLAHADCPIAFIAVNDIGEVAGGKHEVVTLLGPEIITYREAVKIIAKECEFRDVVVENLTEEDHLKLVPSIHQDILKSCFKYYKGLEVKHEDVSAAENVKRFTGRPATKFADWVRANKHRYAV
ncbi:hypothetical protein HK101_010398 [Irineochytrium annulatum]|nr:hypothetical protein HK101_010398 [Irineochytrium annulatum]